MAKLEQESLELIQKVKENINESTTHLASGNYYARDSEKALKDEHSTNNETFKKEAEKLRQIIIGDNTNRTLQACCPACRDGLKSHNQHTKEYQYKA